MAQSKALQADGGENSIRVHRQGHLTGQPRRLARASSVKRAAVSRPSDTLPPTIPRSVPVRFAATSRLASGRACRAGSPSGASAAGSTNPRTATPTRAGSGRCREFSRSRRLPLQTQWRASPRSSSLSAARQDDIAARLRPRHGRSKHAEVQWPALSGGVASRPPQPLIDQRRLDPTGETPERLPQMPRHPQLAPAPQRRRINVGSVQRMGGQAALANRSFWLACG